MKSPSASATDPIVAPAAEGTYEIRKIASIRISLENRKRFNETALQNLAASIKETGVIQPLVVRPVTPTAEQPETHEIVAGERRYRASKIAGLDEVPVMVRVLTDLQAAKIRILENLQREDPHPMEEAEGYQQLMLTHGLTADQLATEVKQSKSYIYARLKLCALSNDVREQFLSDKLPASSALLIARIPVPALQSKALSEILAPTGANGEAMSVRRATEHIQGRYMLTLDEAIFPLADAKLLASAGACTKCPKRTGNQPEIFNDVKNADVCTDPDCFAEKRAAQTAKVIVLANKNGIPIHEGEEGRNLIAVQWNNSSKLASAGASLQSFNRNAPHTKNSGTVQAHLPAEALPAPAAYVKMNDGRLITFYDRTALQVALEKAGACETVEVHAQRMKELKASEKAGDASKGDAAKKEKAERDRVAAKERALEKQVADETAFRVALYKQLRTRMQNGLSIDSLRQYAKRAVAQFSLPDDILDDVYKFDASSDKSLCAYIDTAPVGEIQLILVDLMFGEILAVQAYHFKHNADVRSDDDFQAILAMARHEGIDPDAVEKAVMMARIDIADLDANQVRDFVEANPDRINELAQFIISKRPLLVSAMEIAAKDLGYDYRPMKDGGYVRRPAGDLPATASSSVDGAVQATLVDEATAAAAPGKTSAKAAPNSAKTPTKKPAATSPANAAPKASKPAAKPIATTKPAAAPKKTAAAAPAKAIAPAAAWPFPRG